MWTPARFTDFASPVADIQENAERIIVKLDIPGMQASDIDIDVQPHSLSIHALRRRAYSARSYNQSWSFVSTIDSENVHAHLEDGVLTVVLPKVAARKVTVHSTNSETNSPPSNVFDRFRSWLERLFA